MTSAISISVLNSFSFQEIIFRMVFRFSGAQEFFCGSTTQRPIGSFYSVDDRGSSSVFAARVYSDIFFSFTFKYKNEKIAWHWTLCDCVTAVSADFEKFTEEHFRKKCVWVQAERKMNNLIWEGKPCCSYFRREPGSGGYVELNAHYLIVEYALLSKFCLRHGPAKWHIGFRSLCVLIRSYLFAFCEHFQLLFIYSDVNRFYDCICSVARRHLAVYIVWVWTAHVETTK